MRSRRVQASGSDPVIPDTFQRQQSGFDLGPVGITGEVAPGPYDAVAGHHYHNGIVPHRIADRLRGHLRNARAVGDHLCYLPVCDGGPVGDGPNNVPDLQPEGGAG